MLDNVFRKTRYNIESALVRLVYGFFRSLSIYRASELCGYTARIIGPVLPRNRIARSNLIKALPELSEVEITRITTNMWENFGRTFAEFPHMSRLDHKTFQNLVTIDGIEHLENICTSGKGSIFFAAHLANWEMVMKLFSIKGYPLSVVYRKANNPGLINLIQGLRKDYIADAIPKGKTGSYQMLQTLKNGGRVGLLIDQKMNDGIKVKFFGMDAMTAPAIARLALKYDYPVLPIRVIRLVGPSCKIIISPPLKITKTGDVEKDTYEIMTNINAILEGWIREYPEQWIWFHNRWSTNNDPA